MVLELNQVYTQLLSQPVSLRVITGDVATVDVDEAAGDDLLLSILGLRPLRGGVVSFDGAPLTPLSAPWFSRLTAFAPSTLNVVPDSAAERAMCGRGYHAGTLAEWCVEMLGLPTSLMGNVESEAALIGMDIQAVRQRPLAELTVAERRQLLLAVAAARAPQLLLVSNAVCQEGYLQQLARRRQLAVLSAGRPVTQAGEDGADAPAVAAQVVNSI